MKAVYHFLKSVVVLVSLKNQSERRGKKIQLGKPVMLERLQE